MYKTHLQLDKPTVATLGLIGLFVVMFVLNAVVLWGHVSAVFLVPTPPVPPGPIDAAALGKAVELLGQASQ